MRSMHPMRGAGSHAYNEPSMPVVKRNLVTCVLCVLCVLCVVGLFPGPEKLSGCDRDRWLGSFYAFYAFYALGVLFSMRCVLYDCMWTDFNN
jgi:hypothetical protein